MKPILRKLLFALSWPVQMNKSNKEYIMNNKLDNELFELCKGVYEKFGWDDVDFRFVQAPTRSPQKYEPFLPPVVEYAPEVSNEMRWTGCRFTPLYTSDYLLDKLPELIAPDFLELKKSFGQYSAYYSFSERQIADTPLKALLKLTLVLHASGEIK